MKKVSVYKSAQAHGSKDTKARTALLHIFQNKHVPFTEVELRASLAAKGIVVNKTTIYRQLAQLKESGRIIDVDFGDGKKRYELSAGAPHHHHLVCTNCNTITDVDIEKTVKSMEQKLARYKKFKIIHHSLEFFGLCQKCK